MDPRELTRQLAEASSAQAVLDLLEIYEDYADFNAIHVSTAYVRLAKFEGQITQRLVQSAAWTWLRRKASTLNVHAPLFGEQAVANMMLSLGHLHPKDERLLDFATVLAERALLLLPQRRLKPLDISNMMWAIAKVKQSGLERASVFYKLLPGLCNLIPSQAVDITAPGLSNTLWAAGILVEDVKVVKDVVPSLSRQAPRCAAQMTPQGLANTCWGLAWLGCKDAVTLGTLANITVKAVSDWPVAERNMDLPMIIAAFAKLKVASKVLMRTVAGFTEPELSNMSGWRICVLCWSHRELDIKSDYIDYRTKVTAEVQRRGLEAFVNISARGPVAFDQALK